MQTKHIIGKKFGRLTVISHTNERSGTQRKVLCRCECGNLKKIRPSHLVSNKIRACGCLSYRHRMSNTPIWKKWHQMTSRCLHSSNYRSISVCKRWLVFENFYEDMNPSFKQHCKEFGNNNTTLDRINVYGNYNKRNCRWATIKEQANNRTTNKFLTMRGTTQSVQKWSEDTGINHSVIRARIKRGWSVKNTLTTPVKQYRSRRTGTLSTEK